MTFPSGRYVVDGELVAETFGTLGNRIHPAEIRIKRLAEETPARFIAFDLLADGDEVLIDRPYTERRARLEALGAPGLELTPVVHTAEEAAGWLETEEGVIAKVADAPYMPGERKAMLKIKRQRTADAVLVGWRPGKAEGTVGALILAMAEEDGETMRVVGHVSGFTAKQKRELVETLKPFETGARGSGDPSRWTGNKDLTWVELRPELCVEIGYDHVSDGRIRHGAKFVRWRPDKDPKDCPVSQLDE